MKPRKLATIIKILYTKLNDLFLIMQKIMRKKQKIKEIFSSII